MRLCSPGGDDTQGARQTAQVCDYQRWEVGGREAGRGAVWAALPSQLMPQGRIQPQLEVEMFRLVVLRSVCCTALEFSQVQSHQTRACCRQKGHLGPISWAKGAGHEAPCLLCLGGGWAHCSLLVGKFPRGEVQRKEAAQLESLAVLVSTPTTTLSGVVWLEWRVQEPEP